MSDGRINNRIFQLETATERARKRIEALWEVVMKPRERAHGTDEEADAAQQQRDAAPGKIPFVPPAPRNANSARQNEKREKWWKGWGPYERIIQVFTLLGVLAAAGIYYEQWGTMVDTVSITRKNYERDARAWILIRYENSVAQKPVLKVGEPLVFPFSLKIIGRTPARNIYASTYVEVVPNGKLPDFDYDRLGRPEAHDFTGQAFAESLPTPMPQMRSRVRTEVPPSAEPWPLEQSEYDSLMRGDSFVAGHGIVRYEDVFHVQHWSKFCYWFPYNNAKTYKAQACAQQGNASDDNDEP